MASFDPFGRRGDSSPIRKEMMVVKEGKNGVLKGV